MARYSRRRVTWRDKPLYNTRIPFSDCGSHLNRMHTVKKEMDLDINKERSKGNGQKRPRENNKRKRTSERINRASTAGIIGYQARHLVKEGAGGKPITELMKEDFAAAGRYAKSAFKWIGEAVGNGVVDAEAALSSLEVPLLEAGTELAELGILLMV